MLMLKSFGFGIMSAEIVPSNDQSDKNEIFTRIENAEINPLEIVIDPLDHNRVYILLQDGHRPSQYEFLQMESSCLEKLRTAIDMNGSQRFSDRVTMLETEKTLFPDV